MLLLRRIKAGEEQHAAIQNIFFYGKAIAVIMQRVKCQLANEQATDENDQEIPVC